MTGKEDEFLKTLRATFTVEAQEHLHAIATGLLELEKELQADACRTLIETVFRAAHSLKGAAHAVGVTEVESHCQELEDMLAAWKRTATAPPARAGLDAAHRLLNAITSVLSACRDEPAVTVSPVKPAPLPFSSEKQQPIVERTAESGHREARREVRAESSLPVAASIEKTFSPDETVRITIGKLDACLLEAEEMVTVKLTTAQRAEDLRELTNRLESWRKEWTTIEPEFRLLRHAVERSAAGRTEPSLQLDLGRFVEFFESSFDQFKSLEARVNAVARAAHQDCHVIGKRVDELLGHSKNLLLLPFATLTASFPKLVRDLCQDQGKQADLVIRGEGVEIDKRILEEMKDPLIHLLRNCVDHGIEKPEQRMSAGKPARASITVALSQLNGNKVELLVSDDGAGLDREHIKETAVNRGVISASEAREMSVEAVTELIFLPEISTSPIITRVSGRGLGLAIVREKLDKLGGSVSVESQPQQGTTFRIVLPTVLAVFRGILVEAAGQCFVIPSFHVERATRVQPDDIQTVKARETISLNGRAVSLVSLADVLELPSRKPEVERAATPTILLAAGAERIAFAVDAVLGEEEVLIKPFRKPLSRVRNVAGATVLGSGRIAPVLNVIDLFKSAKKIAASGPRVTGAPKPVQAQTKAILVAEDSITSRILLKSILESAGYIVKTAIDGIEAFTALRAEHFDLVVSDVEMPRLNGFDLTAKIRSDKKLSELPVVLVTALETREDRERGIDVGANAYIIKSRFDQSNLLDAIRRLL